MNMKSLIGTARAFKQAAYRCGKDIPDDSYDSRRLIIPEIACLAFSLELYIKFLIKITINIDEEGHDLKKLYNRLGQDMKDLIESKIGFQKSTFENYLEMYKKTFIQWRYFHEGKDLQVTDIRFFENMIFAMEEIVQNSGYPYPGDKYGA